MGWSKEIYDELVRQAQEERAEFEKEPERKLEEWEKWLEDCGKNDHTELGKVEIGEKDHVEAISGRQKSEIEEPESKLPKESRGDVDKCIMKNPDWRQDTDHHWRRHTNILDLFRKIALILLGLSLITLYVFYSFSSAGSFGLYSTYKDTTSKGLTPCIICGAPAQAIHYKVVGGKDSGTIFSKYYCPSHGALSPSSFFGGEFFGNDFRGKIIFSFIFNFIIPIASALGGIIYIVVWPYSDLISHERTNYFFWKKKLRMFSTSAIFWVGSLFAWFFIH